LIEEIGTPEQIAADARAKQERVRVFLEREGLDALVLGRQDNFSWMTAGGDSHVVITSEMGAGYLVIGRDRQWLVSHWMDRQRFTDDYATSQSYEPVGLHWYQGSPEDKILDLTKGMKIGADFGLAGAHCYGRELVDLHYPLTDLEMERYRWIGHTVNRILVTVAQGLQPGLTEREIAARLLYEYAQLGFTIDVLLVGTDERIARYRHTVPTGKPLQRYALLHPAARRWGLHANVTRLVHFGEPPPDVRRAMDAVAIVGASVATMLAPGVRFADVLEEEIRLYRKLGYRDEWYNHFQGGITGYTLADPTRCQDAEARVVERQAYDYFITVTGAKFEELMLLAENGVELASSGPGWPARTVETSRGEIQIPDVLIR
jgi:Xaa-Pro dipeptidase